ncbi:MAG: CCA tRNA nucleotidyltransferase [Ignavibacteria bacterium]|nr:CCA tRNA nucleotidyltransferase [Ignavibacteria bacterium]
MKKEVKTNLVEKKRKRIVKFETIYQAKPVEKVPIQDPTILAIAQLAKKYNFELYLVGGTVRDFFLKRERYDVDFTVVGDSIEFSKIVSEHFKTKIITFPRFFTSMVPIGNRNFEFVGTRKEVYIPSSRKPIVSTGTLEDDLRRRDFTINAMAVSLNEPDFGKLIDLFDGFKDLQNKIIRTPLDPKVTYEDDPLRMLRAIRFASQLNFTIEQESLDTISEMRHRIEIVSQERITDELLKILESQKPSIGFSLLYTTGLLELIFPELNAMAGVETREENGISYAHKDVFTHSLKVLDKIAEISNNLWLRFSALIHDIGKPKTKRFVSGIGWTFYGHEEIGAKMVPDIFRKLKLPFEKIEYVERLVRLHQRPMALVDEGVTDSAIRRLAAYAGDALEDLFLLCRSDITTNNPNLSKKYLNNYQKVWNKVLEVQEKDKLRQFQSPIRGEEIMETFGLSPSPEVGIIKTAIEEAILEGIIPNEPEPARNFMNERIELWKNLLQSVNIRDIKRDKDLIKKIFVYSTLKEAQAK